MLEILFLIVSYVFLILIYVTFYVGCFGQSNLLPLSGRDPAWNQSRIIDELCHCKTVWNQGTWHDEEIFHVKPVSWWTFGGRSGFVKVPMESLALGFCLPLWNLGFTAPPMFLSSLKIFIFIEWYRTGTGHLTREVLSEHDAKLN